MNAVLELNCLSRCGEASLKEPCMVRVPCCGHQRGVHIVVLAVEPLHRWQGQCQYSYRAEELSFLATMSVVRCWDWNSHLPDVLGTRLNEVLKGQSLRIGQGTAEGRRCK